MTRCGLTNQKGELLRTFRNKKQMTKWAKKKLKLIA